MTTRPIKTAALLLSIATVALASFGAAQAQETTAALTVTFKGITKPTGQLLGQVFADQAAYEGKGKPVAAFQLPVAGDTVSTTFPGLAPGRYAVRVLHDVDGDGKMATNPFGITTEPFAFSNDAKGAFGPAAWADAAFDVGAADQTIAITID